MTITVQELKDKFEANEKVNLIDVREIYEFEESKITGSQNIPLGTLMSVIEELNDLKDQEIIMQCRSGHRSSIAQQLLIGAGFLNVKNLTGGILAWQQAGY
jgi:rhodanese-related sulfurtransferase